MGQYWKPVNLDKKEYIHPYKLASGLKLWEMLAHECVGKALIVLTAAMPEPRGGGDLKPDPIIGRWAGDRIAIVGDYAKDSDLAPEHHASTIYGACDDGTFRDVTEDVCRVLERELEGEFTGDGWKDFVRAV